MTARVVVTMAAHALQPSSLHVVYGVAPLTQLGAAAVRRTTRGGETHRRVRGSRRVPLRRVPSGRQVAPGAVRVDVARSDGSRVQSVAAAWAPLTVTGRTTAADLRAAKPPFRADDDAPARDVPAAAGAARRRLLDGAAALLAAAARGLAAADAPPTHGGRDAPAAGRRARARTAARPRRARRARSPIAALRVGYVARVLSAAAIALAHAADELAWSRPAPLADSLTELVDEVEAGARTR